MAFIELIKNKYSSISIVGMAKNAGKTVTLNKLIEEANNISLTIGITSTGRDGERSDVVTNTEKPAIYVEKGTLITTAENIINLKDAKIEILQVTKYRSPLGNIVIGKVVEAGFIQIAGPSSNAEIKEIINDLKSLGAHLVIVDGSINRKTSASPGVTEATILSTGAVISRDMNKVIEETIHTSNIFKLKSIEKKVKEKISGINNFKVLIIDKDYNVKNLELKTSINNGNYIASHINNDTKYVVFSGALLKKTVEDIFNATKNRDFTFVVNDGTKVFIDSKNYNILVYKGMKIEVINPINLIAITLNPYSPSGYYFEPTKFLSTVSSYIKDIKIFDVMQL